MSKIHNEPEQSDEAEKDSPFGICNRCECFERGRVRLSLLPAFYCDRCWRRIRNGAMIVVALAYLTLGLPAMIMLLIEWVRKW